MEEKTGEFFGCQAPRMGDVFPDSQQESDCQPIDPCKSGHVKATSGDPEVAAKESENFFSEGWGRSDNCDPQQAGHITQNQSHHHDRNVVYKYSRSIRGTDEAMQDLFRDLVVIDENSKSHPVPIIWGTQERAVAAVIQETYRDDTSLALDKIKLPMLAIHSTAHDVDMSRYTYHKAVNYLRNERFGGKPGFTTKEKFDRDTIFGVTRGVPVDISYTLYAWTLYQEDMNQILSQIFQKTVPMTQIKIKGIGWPVNVTLESTANNIDYEPGDQNTRVIKYQFNFVAKTYVAQPILKKRAILKTQVDVVSGDLSNPDDLIHRLQEAVEGTQ